MLARCYSWLSFLCLSKCCHMQMSSNVMLIMWRFATSKDKFTSGDVVSYHGGRWKCGDVALQAVGSHNTWMGFFTLMNFVVSPEHMRVIVVVTAEGAVVRIQTFGTSCEGIQTSELFLICSEHLVEILAVFLVYKAVMQDGGFTSGCNGVGMVQNCPFASWQILNWWGNISTAMVLFCVIPRYWVLMS